MRYRKSRLFAWSTSLIIVAVYLVAAPRESKAQQPAAGAQAAPRDELPDSLEEMLAVALANNPDVRAAESHVEQAQVELNRIRLEIAQRVVTAHNALDTQRNEIGIAQLQFQQVRARVDSWREANKAQPGSLSESEIREGVIRIEESERAILREEAKLSDLEAELRYLLGRFPKAIAHGTFGEAAARITGTFTPRSPYLNLLNKENRFNVPAKTNRAANAPDWTIYAQKGDPLYPMIERIRKPLDKPLGLSFIGAPLEDVLLFLQASTGVQFVTQPVGLAEANIDLKEEEITVEVGNLESVASAIRVIRDLVPALRFVVRDYGILVTSELGVEPGAILVCTPNGS